MFRSDKFYFSGVPESVKVEQVGEGFKVILKCSNIKFKISNLNGVITSENIYYFTSKKEVAENLNRELSVEGVISTEDHNGNRNLITLKLK